MCSESKNWQNSTTRRAKPLSFANQRHTTCEEAGEDVYLLRPFCSGNGSCSRRENPNYDIMDGDGLTELFLGRELPTMLSEQTVFGECGMVAIADYSATISVSTSSSKVNNPMHRGRSLYLRWHLPVWRKEGFSPVPLRYLTFSIIAPLLADCERIARTCTRYSYQFGYSYV